jgi:hypothetical protein
MYGGGILRKNIEDTGLWTVEEVDKMLEYLLFMKKNDSLRKKSKFLSSNQSFYSNMFRIYDRGAKTSKLFRMI